MAEHAETALIAMGPSMPEADPALEQTAPKQLTVGLSIYRSRMKKINFYSTRDAYGEFSNFARYRVWLKGKYWPTSEHYFQAQKFAGTQHEEQVRNAPTAMQAAQMGREPHRPLRSDWESVKEEVMLEVLRAKFTQHKSLRSLLLSTGAAELVEHTANDNYWGDGGDGSGKNRLGALLMQVRAELRQSTDESQGVEIQA